METIRLHHGGSIATFYRLGEFVAWYALGQGKAPPEIQDQMRQAIRDTAMGLGLRSPAVEQILNSPASIDFEGLFDSKFSKVFIVLHGRNHAVRNALDLYVRDLGLETFVMDATAHLGRNGRQRKSVVAFSLIPIPIEIKRLAAMISSL